MNSQSTSFIPQRPTPGKIKNRGVRKIYILTYVSYVLFFGTVIAAAAIFFFTMTLESQLTGLQQQLAAEKSRFSESDIESVRELDQRIAIAKERMSQHISVLSIFEALEQKAIQSLQYVGFSYIRSNEFNPVVTVTGTTQAFNSVLFQREVLSSNPILSGSSFSETSLATHEGDEETNKDAQTVITFQFVKDIDPETVAYTPRLTTEDPSVSSTSAAVEILETDANETTDNSDIQDTTGDTITSDSENQ